MTEKLLAETYRKQTKQIYSYNSFNKLDNLNKTCVGPTQTVLKIAVTQL